MADERNKTGREVAAAIARTWCESRGAGWSVIGVLGAGGTAPVFEVASPEGPCALKIYDEVYSTGEKRAVESKRIEQQLSLKGHTCPHLVRVIEGGEYDGRLFLLMERAAGRELAKCLSEVPRRKIRTILDQIARAAIYLNERGLCHRDIKAENVFISDDFENCKLLDTSVVREISDPVGAGTDHGERLPVVATARYSPPEYLFRLIEPGPELWHALTLYQLGALLHDLIMKQSLFETQYRECSINRYRFAWVVATVTPEVSALDVDRDLVLLAQRALDKDWKRRSALQLEDFLADERVVAEKSLEILGLSKNRKLPGLLSRRTSGRSRLSSIATEVEHVLLERLCENGARSTHRLMPGGTDLQKTLSFSWTNDMGTGMTETWTLEVNLALFVSHPPSVAVSIRLSGSEEGPEALGMDLPPLVDSPQIAIQATEAIYSALTALAVKHARTRTDEC